MIVFGSTIGHTEVKRFLEDVVIACEAGLGIRPLTEKKRNEIKEILSYANEAILTMEREREG